MHLMKTAIFSVSAALSLNACTKMQDYYPNSKIVQVEGRDFFVTARPSSGPGVYLAGPNEVKQRQLWIRDLALPAANVLAIERATGCRVLPETILNISTGPTYAAVKC
jgi:hypothetical protein